jgi:serine/threonine-protein kinase
MLGIEVAQSLGAMTQAFVPSPQPIGFPYTDAATPAELAPGVVLDRKYRLDALVGEGGMGMIWLATQLDLDRHVAVKIIRHELAHDGQIVARMLFEARSIAQLRGEHVVRVLDIARLESGAPYIVMEYLDGNDLAAELASRGPLPIDEAVDVMLQACEGLAEAHAAGIVHRDLKPENLYLAVQPDGSIVVKILDFGISKQMRKGSARTRRLTHASAVVGSPHYMAPEQMRGIADLDQRADIWSLGAILYEIMTGVSPFDGPTPEAVCTMAVDEEPVLPRAFRPDMPEALQLVLLKCLEKDRERRYASVDELAHDLAPFGTDASRSRAQRISRVVAGPRFRGMEVIEDADTAPLPSRVVNPAPRIEISAPPISDPYAAPEGPPSYPPRSSQLTGVTLSVADDELDINAFKKRGRGATYVLGAVFLISGGLLLFAHEAPQHGVTALATAATAFDRAAALASAVARRGAEAATHEHIDIELPATETAGATPVEPAVSVLTTVKEIEPAPAVAPAPTPAPKPKARASTPKWWKNAAKRSAARASADSPAASPAAAPAPIALETLQPVEAPVPAPVGTAILPDADAANDAQREAVGQ